MRDTWFNRPVYNAALRVLLDRMCERHSLYHRVELLGIVALSDVRDVLVRRHHY